MRLRELLDYALIGAIDLENKLDVDQIKSLLKIWKSEWNTDIDLISFRQAFPDNELNWLDEMDNL